MRKCLNAENLAKQKPLSGFCKIAFQLDLKHRRAKLERFRLCWSHLRVTTQ